MPNFWNQLKENLKSILARYPDTRNDYLAAYVMYMNKFHWASINPQQLKILQSGPTQANIQRVQRAMQKEWIYPPSQEVKEARLRASNKYRQEYRWK